MACAQAADPIRPSTLSRPSRVDARRAIVLLALSLISVAVTYVVLAGILFVPAGRTDLPLFWAYLATMLALTVIAVVVVIGRNPDLAKEQRKPGEGNQDRLTVPLFLSLFLVHWIVAGLDVGRYQWSSSVPFLLQIVGLVVFGAGFGLVIWSTIVNRFYSSAVRIQADRGQEVITTGPYQFVRHPGYIGWILFMLFSGLALGSWVSILPMLFLAPLIVRRTVIEDRMLSTGLKGYTDYAVQVRYRLIPGLW
jgi:protein-S-isoprenylcysteine O-methyltransferase Ste14